MPVIYEDFLRCPNCGHPDFKEEKVLTFHKTVKARDSKAAPLDNIGEEYKYFCMECNTQLEK